MAAAFYGQVSAPGLVGVYSQLTTLQAKLSPEELQKLCQTLGLDSQNLTNTIGSQWWPTRGLGPTPPTDPVIYRLYEARLLFLQTRKSSMIKLSFITGCPCIRTCDQGMCLGDLFEN